MGRWAGWVERWQASGPGRFLSRFHELDLLTHAASLAFYALLSLAPLLVLVLWLAASSYPSAQETLLEQMQAFAGRDARAVARTVLDNAEREPGMGSLAGFWSTALLFIGASTVFARLQATLNRIFATDASRLPGGVAAWLRKRLFSFGVVLALGFLLVVSTLLNTAVQLLFANLPSLLPALGNLVTLLLYVLAFALLYRWLPDRRVGARQALVGGLITSALFVLGRWGIGLYLARAAPGSAYGSFGTLVILLVWMYYAALIFFTGALITAMTDPARTAASD
jgi:membrane protein